MLTQSEEGIKKGEGGKRLNSDMKRDIFLWPLQVHSGVLYELKRFWQ